MEEGRESTEIPRHLKSDLELDDNRVPQNSNLGNPSFLIISIGTRFVLEKASS